MRTALLLIIVCWWERSLFIVNDFQWIENYEKRQDFKKDKELKEAEEAKYYHFYTLTFLLVRKLGRTNQL